MIRSLMVLTCGDAYFFPWDGKSAQELHAEHVFNFLCFAILIAVLVTSSLLRSWIGKREDRKQAALAAERRRRGIEEARAGADQLRRIEERTVSEKLRRVEVFLRADDIAEAEEFLGGLQREHPTCPSLLWAAHKRITAHKIAISRARLKAIAKTLRHLRKELDKLHEVGEEV